MSASASRGFLGVLATAAVAVFVVPAHALILNTGFDPVFFSGVGQFYIDDPCLIGSGNYSGPACDMSLLSASTSVMDAGGTASLNFGAAPADASWEVYVSDGAVVGLQTDPIGGIPSTSCTGDLCNEYWWIQWVYTPPAWQEQPGTEVVDLYACTDVPTVPCTPNFTGPPTGKATHVSFTTPEPGTLGLIFGGVGGAWWARRRKKAA